MRESSRIQQSEDESVALAPSSTFAFGPGAHVQRARRARAQDTAYDDVGLDAPASAPSAPVPTAPATTAAAPVGNSSAATLDPKAEIETLLTAADVAKWLKISRSAAYALMHRLGSTVHIGRSRRLSRASLIAFMQKGGDSHCPISSSRGRYG